MRYDHGDSFHFDFEPNGIPFGLKSKGKLSPRSYPIQCDRNSAGTCSNCFIAYLFARLYSNNRFIPRISSDILMFVFILRTIIIC